MAVDVVIEAKSPSGRGMEVVRALSNRQGISISVSNESAGPTLNSTEKRIESASYNERGTLFLILITDYSEEGHLLQV